MCDACYVEQRCLAFLMSADATGAMLDPWPIVLGCDGQFDLAAKGKVSIQRRSGVAGGEYTGQTTRGCGREPEWVSEAWEGSAELWRATGMLASRISKHAGSVTW